MLRLVTSVILSTALILPSSTLRTQNKVPSSQVTPRAARPKQKPALPQELFCPLWRIDHTFEATIRIKNELVIGPMTVAPVLFMADGTEFDLAPLTIESTDVVTISINDALQQVPASVQPHVSQFGSAALRFLYGWNAVSGSIQSIDRPRSLTYQYPFVQSMSMGSSHQVLEGLWWKHDPGVDGFIALSNTTATPTEAHIGLSDTRGLDGPGRVLTVPAHGTRWAQFSALDPIRLRDARGGITVSWEGETNGLIVAGGLENASEGFSAPMVFRTLRSGKSAEQAIRYASVGIMVGSPDPMMGFPEGTKFTPYAVLRNGDSKPLDVQPALYYLQGMATVTLSVQRFTLLAHQTTSLDVYSLLEAAGVKTYSGTIHLEFSYQGDPGALIIAAGSVDQSGTYVFDVAAKGINQDRGKRISYWENGGGTDTMITLWNPESSPQSLLVSLYFHGGTYRVPVQLNAKGTYMFNISELAMAQKPDQDGHILPRDAKIGSALVTDAKNRLNRVTIVVTAGAFNVQTATCGEQCSGCDDVQDLEIYGPSVPIGDTGQWNADCTWPDGSVTDCTGDVYWSSYNTSVATFSDNAYGEVFGIAPGAANIEVELDETITDSMCYTQGYCDYYSAYASGTVTVLDSTPLLSGIDPSDWTAGNTTQVTFSGQYFGTNAPTLSFSPSAGISYSLSSYNDTQIVASVTVSAGTPDEQVTVSITNNGYGGNSFNGTSAGESPTSPSVYATVHSPINSPEVTVIAWVDGTASDLQNLPGGANQTLVTDLNSNPTSCGTEIFFWSVVGVPTDIHSSTDQAYANAWLVKYSANPAPPATITPTDQLNAGNFRLIGDFGNNKGFYKVGVTPDPCGTSVPKSILNWIGAGQPSPYMGASGTSPSGQIYQLQEGRVGKLGQQGSETLNGRTVPWIWSVIEFDSSGNPTYSDHGVFPTYSVYVNGSLAATYAQSTVASFVLKDETYQRTPSQIP